MFTLAEITDAYTTLFEITEKQYMVYFESQVNVVGNRDLFSLHIMHLHKVSVSLITVQLCSDEY